MKNLVTMNSCKGQKIIIGVGTLSVFVVVVGLSRRNDASFGSIGLTEGRTTSTSERVIASNKSGGFSTLLSSPLYERSPSLSLSLSLSPPHFSCATACISGVKVEGKISSWQICTTVSALISKMQNFYSTAFLIALNYIY